MTVIRVFSLTPEHSESAGNSGSLSVDFADRYRILLHPGAKLLLSRNLPSMPPRSVLTVFRVTASVLSVVTARAHAVLPQWYVGLIVEKRHNRSRFEMPFGHFGYVVRRVTRVGPKEACMPPWASIWSPSYRIDLQGAPIKNNPLEKML